MCASKDFFSCILNVILSSFTWPHVVPLCITFSSAEYIIRLKNASLFFVYTIKVTVVLTLGGQKKNLVLT